MIGARAARVLGAIAGNSAREAAASRLGVALALVAGALALGGAALGALTLDDPAAAARDLGLAGVDLALVAAAVVLGVGLTARALGSGATQAMLARPVARWQLMAGQWLGLLLVLGAAAGALGAAVTLTLVALGGHADAALVQAIWLYAVGASVVASLAQGLATVMRPLPAGAAALALAAIGRAAPELHRLAARGGGTGARVLGGLARLLPNLQLFVPPRAAPVGARYLVVATAYGLGYGLVVMAASAAALRRRDFV